MEVTALQLFALLRAALWKEEVDVSLFKGAVDWKAVSALAFRQTVLGLLYEGIMQLPQEYRPERALILKLHSWCVQTVQRHHLLNEVWKEIAGRLEGEQIHCVLLKGQGLAANYPEPLRRACGDIDLYVGSENYPRVCRLLADWGMLTEEASETMQHLHLTYRSVTLEIHRITGVMYHWRINRAFRAWSDALLQGPDCRTMEVGGKTVYLPPVRFDALFIFYHLHRHLLTGGVGLRQFCDCMMFLHAYAGEVDRSLLEKDLNEMGLMRGWQIMGYLVVNFLGMPKEEFPFYADDKDVRESAGVMLELVLRNGNFGFFNPVREGRPEGYLSGKLHSLKVTVHHLRQMSRLFPKEVWAYWTFYLWRGVTHAATDWLKKKSAG